MMELEHQLNMQLVKSFEGREVWLGLVESTNLQKDDYVILFPSTDSEINYFGLVYLDQFIERVNAQRIFIITQDQFVRESCTSFSSHIIRKIDYSIVDIESLLYFYRLYKFTNNLIIVALDELPGRSLRNLLNIKEVSLKDLVKVGIYGIGI